MAAGWTLVNREHFEWTPWMAGRGWTLVNTMDGRMRTDTLKHLDGRTRMDTREFLFDAAMHVDVSHTRENLPRPRVVRVHVIRPSKGFISVRPHPAIQSVHKEGVHPLPHPRSSRRGVRPPIKQATLLL